MMKTYLNLHRRNRSVPLADLFLPVAVAFLFLMLATASWESRHTSTFGAVAAFTMRPMAAWPRQRQGPQCMDDSEITVALTVPQRRLFGRRPSQPLRGAARGNDDSASTSRASQRLSKPSSSSSRQSRARDLILSLVEDSKCFETKHGARAFGDACVDDVVYDDRYERQPATGREAVVRYLTESKHHPRRHIRIDRITDGDTACGFCWTWVSGDQEGLRGTTFVELDGDNNDNDAPPRIKYVCEIPEPIFKPGDVTKELLQALTRGAEPKPVAAFEVKTPTVANEIAKYLYVDLQQAGDDSSMDELMKLLDDNIVYRDFNYPDVMNGKDPVRKFVQDFTFPGIEFRPLKFDDGVDSTCFTWEVVLEGVDSDQTIKGISFYELNPATRKIAYIRDVPESAIKPPILGKLARDLRPGLGVFEPCPVGSRPGGM